MKTTNSYIEMKMHSEGKDPLVLRVPTFWDSVELQWIGFIQTPVTKKIITGKGVDSFDLQNDFNTNISKLLHSEETSAEVVSMFKPEKDWE